jgi:putative sugar O-methyltransferase
MREDEAILLTDLQEDVEAARRAGLLGLPGQELIPKWRRLLTQEPARLFGPGHRLDVEALRQFRRRQIFVEDVPTWDPTRWSLASLLGGGRRGAMRMLRECLELVRASPAEPLLRHHPCCPVGQPCVVRDGGYVYTYRWLKHIWSLGLVKTVLGERLAEDFVGLDIGASCGIFSGLLKRQWSASHHVLVDFPEQLLLARYFLGMWLPGSRIAGLREVLAQERLSREWMCRYDFTLVPATRYERLTEGVADLVTNFASFGEMTRAWFERYVRSPAWTTARYVFLANRIVSRPTYDTDLTLLDYPIWNRAQRLYFGVSPVFSKPYRYRRRWLVGYARTAQNPYFDYLGDQHVG